MIERLIAAFLALFVMAGSSARADGDDWPRGDEWYLAGDDWSLSRVVRLDRSAEVVEFEGTDGVVRKERLDPARYVLLDGEPDPDSALICAQGGSEMFSGTGIGARRGTVSFGERLYPVSGKPGRFDGAARGAGSARFILVSRHEANPRDRSAGWVREEEILRRGGVGITADQAASSAGRPIGRELVPKSSNPRFFESGVNSTYSLEKPPGSGPAVPVPTKAILKNTQKAASAKQFGVEYYDAPGGRPLKGALQVLQHYYVYAGRQAGGSTWYLLGGDEYLPNEAGAAGLIGWVKGENFVLWGTAQAVEFDPVTRPLRTFLSGDRKRVLGLGEIYRSFEDAQARIEGKNVRPAAAEIPEKFSNGLSRMPVLEERTLKVGQSDYPMYRVAYVAHNLVLPAEQQAALIALRKRFEAVSTIEVVFVVDATLNSGVHRSVLREAVTDAWTRLEKTAREATGRTSGGKYPFAPRVRVGILAYRDSESGREELEPFDFTEDRAEFAAWWADGSEPAGKGRRLEYSGGTGKEAHVSSVRRALGVALSGRSEGVEVPLRVPTDDGAEAASAVVKLSWTLGSQRLIVVLGDVGQKDGADPQWSRDRLFDLWKQRGNRPFLVAVQVGQADWFTYPSDEARRVAEAGYERFRSSFLALVGQIVAETPGERQAAYVSMTDPGQDRGRKEMAGALDKIWDEMVRGRALRLHGELLQLFQRNLVQISDELGSMLQETGVDPAKVVQPQIAYDEGWLSKLVPFPDAPGFNLRQVRPAVLIDRTEFNRILMTLQSVEDVMARVLEQAKQPGVGDVMVGDLLAKQMALIPKNQMDMMKKVTARHGALHFVDGILQYTPEQFRGLDNSVLARWRTLISQSVLILSGYQSDTAPVIGQWRDLNGRQISWLPISLLPTDEGLIRLTRAETLRLRDSMLAPLNRAMHESRAVGGDEAPGPALARWLAGPGKDIAGQLANPAFVQARVGILAMSREQVASIGKSDFLMWHQAVFSALRACDATLGDPKAWSPQGDTQVTWYSVSRLPNPDNVLSPDMRELEDEHQAFLRSRVAPTK